MGVGPIAVQARAALRANAGASSYSTYGTLRGGLSVTAMATTSGLPMFGKASSRHGGTKQRPRKREPAGRTLQVQAGNPGALAPGGSQLVAVVQ